MKKMKRILVISLCLTLILPVTGYAVTAGGAEEHTAPDIVCTFEEFDEWMKNNKAGGLVQLGADIEISHPSYSPGIYNYQNNPVTIETGPYQIIITGSMYIPANMQIIGDGIKPVIEIKSGGTLCPGTTTYQAMPVVTATKDNGCAIYFASGSRYADFYEKPILIRTTGANATAIRSEAALYLDSIFIDAPGTGSTGINSTEAITLQFSEITAGRTSIISPAVTIDTCNIAPVPENIIKKTQRKIKASTPSGTSMGYYVYPLGSEEPYLLDGTSLRTFVTLSATGEQDLTRTLSVTYQAPDNLDIYKTGTYYFTGALPEPWNRFGLQSDVQLALETIMYDGRIPLFQEAGIDIWNDDLIQLMYHYQPDQEYELVVLGKRDNSTDWFDYTEMTDMKSGGAYLSLWLTDDTVLQKPLELVIEVYEADEDRKKIGETKIVRLLHDDMGITGLPGGDRTGGDREPDPDPPPAGGTDGSETPDPDPDNPLPGNVDYKDLPPADNNPGSSTEPDKTTASIPDIFSPWKALRQILSMASEKNEQADKETTEHASAISARRLTGYLHTNSQYTFICDDLRLTLTRETVEAFNLTDDDILTVAMHWSASDSITIMLFINDIAILQDFAGPAVLTAPWTEETSQLVDDTGQELSCTYDKEFQTVTASILRSGTYTIITDTIPHAEAEAAMISSLLDIPAMTPASGKLSHRFMITMISIFLTCLLSAFFIMIKKFRRKKHPE